MSRGKTNAPRTLEMMHSPRTPVLLRVPNPARPCGLKAQKICAFEACPSPLVSKKWRGVTNKTSAGGRSWCVCVLELLPTCIDQDPDPNRVSVMLLIFRSECGVTANTFAVFGASRVVGLEDRDCISIRAKQA